ncbi:MAG: hypothetical protein OEZ06_08695 [Myxococcales bacterium]|nr:hypothetical protein [Myxococcales bacterium]
MNDDARSKSPRKGRFPWCGLAPWLGLTTAPLLGPALLATAVLAVPLASPAQASVVQALDLAELVKRSDLIVVATARERSSRQQYRRRTIVTDVSLEVHESLRGGAAVGSTLVVTRLGGRIGDLAMQVPGEATFSLGERALVFLRLNPSTGELNCVGMSQGVMPIAMEQAEPMVIPGGQGAALMHIEDDRLVSAGPALAQPLPLSTLRGQISALIAAERGGSDGSPPR